jgi:hypothetical protein
MSFFPGAENFCRPANIRRAATNDFLDSDPAQRALLAAPGDFSRLWLMGRTNS